MLICSICPRPELLILDEPFENLDVVAKSELKTFLFEYIKSSDRSIILSSHLAYELENIIDIVAILNNGNLTAHATKDNLDYYINLQPCLSFLYMVLIILTPLFIILSYYILSKKKSYHYIADSL